MAQPTDIQQRPAHLFKPGQSGNPSGRPKGAERIIREVVEARGGGFQDLVAAMLDMALSPVAKHADKQRAIEWLFDRVYGKPVAPSSVDMHVSASGGTPAPRPTYTIEQLRAFKAVHEGRLLEAGITNAHSVVRIVDANAEPTTDPAHAEPPTKP